MGNIITHNNIGYLNKFMMDFGKAVPKEIPMNLDGKINIDAIEKKNNRKHVIKRLRISTERKTEFVISIKRKN